MLTKVKKALRISHSFLDDEIQDVINGARAELIRSGISYDMAYSQDDPLILQAVKSYCLSQLSGDLKLAEGYDNAFRYQLDNLRKTPGYMRGGEGAV